MVLDKLYSLLIFQSRTSSAYLGADENLTGKESHLTLFRLLSFSPCQLIPAIPLGRMRVLHYWIIPVPRLCFGHPVGHREADSKRVPLSDPIKWHICLSSF